MEFVKREALRRGGSLTQRRRPGPAGGRPRARPADPSGHEAGATAEAAWAPFAMSQVTETFSPTFRSATLKPLGSM